MSLWKHGPANYKTCALRNSVQFTCETFRPDNFQILQNIISAGGKMDLAQLNCVNRLAQYILVLYLNFYVQYHVCVNKKTFLQEFLDFGNKGIIFFYKTLNKCFILHISVGHKLTPQIMLVIHMYVNNLTVCSIQIMLEHFISIRVVIYLNPLLFLIV